MDIYRATKRTKAPSTRIRIFLNPQLFFFQIRLPSTRIRRIRQRIRKKINPLFRVEKNISAMNSITCGRVNPDIFLSNDVKSVSTLSPNNKPIWRHNAEGEQSKFPATISLYGACSEDILVQRNLGYQSESGYHRIRVDDRIRFEYATCGRRNFCIRNEKVADWEISGYVWTGPEVNNCFCIYHSS